jgi:hypothetical protein
VAAREHARQCGTRQTCHRDHLQANQLFCTVGIERDEWHIATKARIVDQQLQGCVLRNALFHRMQLTRLSEVGHHHLDGNVMSLVQALRQRFQTLAAAGYDDQVVLIARQAFGKGGADA